MRNHSKQHGYTLIELLLYIAITAILLGALALFFAMASSARVKNQTISEVEQQGQFIVESITQAIRSAESITTPSAAASSNNQLLLASSTAALNPTLFNVSGGVISIKEGASGNTIPLTNSKVTVSNFAVKNLSRTGTPGTVQISITLSRVNPSGLGDYDYQKTFTTSASIR